MFFSTSITSIKDISVKVVLLLLILDTLYSTRMGYHRNHQNVYIYMSLVLKGLN